LLVKEASMLLVMQMGNLALTYLTNEVGEMVTYEC
jgi:hypothetical protein